MYIMNVCCLNVYFWGDVFVTFVVWLYFVQLHTSSLLKWTPNIASYCWSHQGIVNTNRESTEGCSKKIVRKNNDTFWKRIGLNKYNICKSQMGRDQVSLNIPFEKLMPLYCIKVNLLFDPRMTASSMYMYVNCKANFHNANIWKKSYNGKFL